MTSTPGNTLLKNREAKEHRQGISQINKIKAFCGLLLKKVQLQQQNNNINNYKHKTLWRVTHGAKDFESGREKERVRDPHEIKYK